MSIKVNEDTTFTVNSFKNKYTIAKLFKPTIEVNGKKKPDLSQQWYVWFRYKYPHKEGMKQFRYKKGINRLKTVSERNFYGNNLIAVYNKMLAEGFNPFSNDKITTSKKDSVRYALDYALAIKKRTVKANTYKGYEHRVNGFTEWAENNGIINMSIKDFTFNHALGFINYLREDKSKGSVGTTIDNHRRELSALFSVMKKDRLISENFFIGIETKRSAPKKHTSFNKKQIKDIKDHLMQHDLQLYYFITILCYSFLRNREVVSLKVGDIDTERKLISIETKNEVVSYKRIVTKVYDILIDKFNIENRNKNDFIFTLKTGVTGNWNASIDQKKKHFSQKFVKVRTALGLDDSYTIYSFRHTIISDIFLTLMKDGLNEREAIFELMSITGHQSEDALRKYLRKIGAILPKSIENIEVLNF